MPQALVLICVLLAGSTARAAGPAGDDREAYEAARAEAGDDPGANVRLALWCESRGMAAERRAHLEAALRADPDRATARGLLGQLKEGGRWVGVEEAVAAARGDAPRGMILSRYAGRRERATETAEAHWQLANWCDENGLKDQARAHRLAVVRISPGREEAWKRLGYRMQKGRWISPDQAAEKAEADAQKKADARWTPLLQKWKSWLGQKARRDDAEAGLANVVDPRAVPSIWKVFAGGNPSEQGLAVRLLARVDGPSATRSLAILAIFGGSDDVRRRADDALRGRDHREADELLIGLLRDPIKFEVKRVEGPGKPGELYVEGERVNRRLFYAAPPPLMTFRPGDAMGYDANGLPVAVRFMGYSNADQGAGYGYGSNDPTAVLAAAAASSPGAGTTAGVKGKAAAGTAASDLLNGGAVGSGGILHPVEARVPVGQAMLQAAQQAELSRQQLDRDVAVLEAINKDIRGLNERAARALESATGERLGEARAAWVSWWLPQKETLAASSPRPLPNDPSRKAAPLPRAGTRSRFACLGAGTPIWTRLGPRPVEDLRVGDEVLTQDTATGALGFSTVLAFRHAPTDPARTIRIGDDRLVATDLARLWMAGRGWVMASHLKPGDRVRTLDGTAEVAGVDDGPSRPVYGLQVAEGRGIFVGDRGFLAHDDRPARPALPPFDAATPAPNRR